MVTGETFYHHAGELVFLAHEYTFVGNEYVIEYYQGFMAAELGVAQVDFGIGFHLAGVAGLAAVNHEHTLGIGRNGERNGIVLVFFLHRDGRHYQVFVAVDRTGLVGFGSTNHDTVGTDFHDVHEQIGVFLLRG